MRHTPDTCAVCKTNLIKIMLSLAILNLHGLMMTKANNIWSAFNLDLHRLLVEHDVIAHDYTCNDHDNYDDN